MDATRRDFIWLGITVLSSSAVPTIVNAVRRILGPPPVELEAKLLAEGGGSARLGVASPRRMIA